MSKHTLSKELQKEIKRLNIEIDLKIIKGLSYKNESRRHKFLVNQLASLRRTETPSYGWMKVVGQFMSSFLF